MLDEKTRKAVALKKFSLIAPVINKQVKSNMGYFIELSKEAIDMPYYGSKKYAAKTFESWYFDYMKGGSIDSLMPGRRGDMGTFRRLSEEEKKKIRELRIEFPKAPATVIYETLVSSSDNSVKASPSTVYRYLKKISREIHTVEKEREIKMYSHENPNELWQTDVMYGPHVRQGKSRVETYLLAYIDDASRLITHGQFYHLQNFESLRNSFREAVLKRGIPKIVYTDNGKIYRSQQFEWMCADIGATIIHSKPFVPRGRGKIERFFKTVRKRFLSTLDLEKVDNIDTLNKRFQVWLNEDYQKKIHSSLNGMTPLDVFMLHIDKINIPDNTSLLKEKFYLRTTRKVTHAATLSLKNFIYETSAEFANQRVVLRYEPEWLGCYETPLLVFNEENQKIGEASLVDFKGNASMKRKTAKSSNDLEQPTSFSDMSKEE